MMSRLDIRTGSLWCLWLIVLSGGWQASAKVISSTIRWERIGATPHQLRFPACMDYNPTVGEADTGCENYKHRMIIFTVDLVLHDSAFTQLPQAGQDNINTQPAFEFCDGSGSPCSVAPLKILQVTESDIEGKPQALVYCQFQKLVSYTQGFAQGPNATATFRSRTVNGNSVQRFPQCLDSNTIAGGPYESACSDCLIGYASELVSLSVTVSFADCNYEGCLPPYDETFWSSHRVYPVTNHHSPMAATLPVITIPRMENAQTAIEFTMFAVDEDGMGQPSSCQGTSSCNNIAATWDMDGASSDGLTLTRHSDMVSPGMGLGEWKLQRRGDTDGGGLFLSVAGPLREPNGLTADAMYPGRLVVEDAFGVSVGQEFMLRVCSSLVPYMVTSSGISLYATHAGRIAPVFIRTTHQDPRQGEHQPASGRYQCYAGSPCSFTLTAAAYASDPSSQSGMSAASGCQWGLTRLSIDGANSDMCVDNIRELESGEAVEMDVSHASVQGCTRSLTSNVFDTGCHSFSSDNPVPGVVVTTVSVFAARTFGSAQPSIADIGRKIGMCFQARSCPTCCFGLQHCVTVEILGNTPTITLPLAPPGCSVATFKSDAIISQVMPDVNAYGNTCPHLFACWNLKDRSTESTPGSPPPEHLPSQYSQAVAPMQFVMAATDQDVSERVDIEFLWAPGSPALSSLREIDQALVSRSPYTFHPGGTCTQQALGELYTLDSTCSSGEVYLNVSTSYGFPGLAPVMTAAADGYNYVEFTRDRTVCFTATDDQAIKWGRGLNNSAGQCHVIRFRGPPVFIQHTALGVGSRDSPFSDIDFNQMGNGTALLSALVGQEVNFTVRARDPNPEDTVSIMVLEDPGLPLGSTLGPNTCVDHGTVEDQKAYPYGGGDVESTCAEAYREFAWTPKEGEDGATYRVCFVAKDTSGKCAGPYEHVLSDPGPRATTGGYYSRPHCVDIQVHQADTAWLPETIPTVAGTNRVEHVGCRVEYALAAGGKKYHSLVSVAAETPLPAGMQMVTLASGFTHAAVLTWTPTRGMEGSAFSVCMDAQPLGWGGGVHGHPKLANGQPGAPRRCLHIKVRRCKYCVEAGDSLLSLIKGLSPDLNWLRLWAANGNDDNDQRTASINDPDMLALEVQQQVVNVGPVYRTRPGDSLMSVAARFRTTVKSLLSLNPDVDVAAALPQQQELCLIPCAT